jgi:hypothetical protein
VSGADRWPWSAEGSSGEELIKLRANLVAARDFAGERPDSLLQCDDASKRIVGKAGALAYMLKQ